MFIRFCTASEQILLLFVADLSQQCHSIIHSYLAAVRYLHLSQGAKDPMADAAWLEQALKGMQRRKPCSMDPPTPSDTMDFVPIINTLLHTSDSYKQLLTWAACSVGFFAFMRSNWQQEKSLMLPAT